MEHFDPRHEDPGPERVIYPSGFFSLVLVKTQVESNDRGTWYSYSITQERMLGEKETDLFKEAEDFSKFCSAGGMDQLQGPKAATIEDKSANKDWED